MVKDKSETGGGDGRQLSTQSDTREEQRSKPTNDGAQCDNSSTEMVEKDSISCGEAGRKQIPQDGV